MSWFSSDDPPEVPDVQDETRDDDRAALRAVYAVLARMPTEERIGLPFRQVDGWELSEVAEQTGMSLATTKRRLTRAVERFEALVRLDDGTIEIISNWLRCDDALNHSDA